MSKVCICIVAADALVLQHQAISINIADSLCISQDRLNKVWVILLYLGFKLTLKKKESGMVMLGLFRWSV